MEELSQIFQKWLNDQIWRKNLKNTFFTALHDMTPRTKHSQVVSTYRKRNSFQFLGSTETIRKDSGSWSPWSFGASPNCGVPSPCVNPSADWSKQRVRPEREAIPASCVGGAELVTLKRTNPSTSSITPKTKPKQNKNHILKINPFNPCCHHGVSLIFFAPSPTCRTM